MIINEQEKLDQLGRYQSDDDLDEGDDYTAEQVQHIYKAIPESRILQQELQNEKFNMTQGSIEVYNNIR